MAAKTTTRKPARKPAALKFADVEARKLADGARPDAAAQQAQLEVWGSKHFTRWTAAATAKAIEADHVDALRTAARQAKVDAMAAAEDFEVETRGQERAFESLCTKYSEGNALLIMAQCAALGLKCRGVQDVAGFQCWQERGRSIIKGQHQAVFIWGHKIERKNDETHEAPAKPAPVKETDTEKKARSFYPIVGLFHISQTTKTEAAQKV